MTQRDKETPDDLTAEAARWQRIADAAHRRGDLDAHRDALEIRRAVLLRQVAADRGYGTDDADLTAVAMDSGAWAILAEQIVRLRIERDEARAEAAKSAWLREAPGLVLIKGCANCPWVDIPGKYCAHLEALASGAPIRANMYKAPDDCPIRATPMILRVDCSDELKIKRGGS
jgi:hypothetical protein